MQVNKKFEEVISTLNKSICQRTIPTRIMSLSVFVYLQPNKPTRCLVAELHHINLCYCLSKLRIYRLLNYFMLILSNIEGRPKVPQKSSNFEGVSEIRRYTHIHKLVSYVVSIQGRERRTRRDIYTTIFLPGQIFVFVPHQLIFTIMSPGGFTFNICCLKKKI